MDKTSWPYEDIVSLPHHVSRRHPTISEETRAAQFLSFAALNGFEDAVEETGRWTERRIELEENEKAAIDEVLHLLEENQSDRPQVRITYFVPDTRKKGGRYITVTGAFKRVDEAAHCIQLCSGRDISLRDVLEISSPQIRTTPSCEEPDWL